MPGPLVRSPAPQTLSSSGSGEKYPARERQASLAAQVSCDPRLRSDMSVQHATTAVCRRGLAPAARGNAIAQAPTS